jgi:hypothetical protein
MITLVVIKPFFCQRVQFFSQFPQNSNILVLIKYFNPANMLNKGSGIQIKQIPVLGHVDC